VPLPAAITVTGASAVTLLPSAWVAVST
jgi:hypothetical protein